jgi:hypothetical protein
MKVEIQKFNRKRMKITRRTNVFIKTERRLIVNRAADEPIYCERCAEQMIRAQTSADVFGVSSRLIYRLIESEKINFVETKTNEIYICPLCAREILESIR